MRDHKLPPQDDMSVEQLEMKVRVLIDWLKRTPGLTMNLTPGDKGEIVESLWHAVDRGSDSLSAVPGLVKRVIETEAWRERKQRGKTYKHDSFLSFITTKPLAGCGWEPEKVKALILDDAEVLALWREATTDHAGGDRPTINDNIMNGPKPKQGTSKDYTLDRLKRQRPDLFRKVVANKLSAHAAAIEAGFIKVPTILEQLRKLWAKASPEDRRALLEEFRRELEDA